MLKRDVFLRATMPANQLHHKRAWLMRVLSAPLDGKAATLQYWPWFQEGKWYVLDANKEPVVVTDADPKEPFIRPREPVTLKADEIPNLKETVKTNYGTAIGNLLFLVYPYGSRYPYHNDRLSGKFLTKLTVKGMRDGTISVAEYDKIVESRDFVTGLLPIIVPSITPKAVTPAPESIALRKRLVNENRDRLHEPAVGAMIDQAVIAKEREFIKGDPAEDFMLKGKHFNVVRKSLFSVQGGTPSLSNPAEMEYIERSLQEGLRPEDMHVVVNKLRSGSYDRGASTALGGAEAKAANRIYQNVKIAEDDCGVTYGHPVEITARTWSWYLGRYLPKATKPLTEADLKKQIGKTIIIRSPATCKTEHLGYCKRCMGDNVALSKLGLVPQVSAVTSRFLSIFLAAFHGKSLKTNPLDLEVAIR